MLLFVLGMSVNAAWANGNYHALMRGVASSTSGGSGKVYVLNHNQAVSDDSETPVVKPYSDLDWNAWTDGAEDWNPEKSNVDVWGTAAYVPGVPEFQADFYAYAKADDGSYFNGWSYYDGGTDLGTNKYLRQIVDPSSEQDAQMTVYTKAKKYTLYATFAPVRVTNYSVSGTMNVPATQGAHGYSTITFDVTGEDVDINDFLRPEVYITHPQWGVDVAYYGMCEQEDPGYPYALNYDKGNYYPIDGWYYEAGKVIVNLDLEVPEGAFPSNSIFKAKVILRSKAGSAVTAPFYIRYAMSETKAASVTVGETETSYATLADAITAANNNAGCTLKLLNNAEVTSTVELTNTMTLDLNGFELKSTDGTTPLTINGSGSDKTVTISQNNLGGHIYATSSSVSVKAVEVLAGTLVLDGGMITAENTKLSPDPSVDATIPTANAIFVANGATLEVNEATIKADANTINAVGIWNEGATTVNDGTISSHAGMVLAVAAQAESNTLTVNGGTLYTVVDQTGITANQGTQSTWSNSYAVYVEQGAIANVNGGTLHSTSTSTTDALAIAAVGSYGTVYLGANATVKGESPREWSYAFAIGMMRGTVTVDGAKLDATYIEDGRPVANPSILKVKYPSPYESMCQLVFNSGYLKDNLYYGTVELDLLSQTLGEFNYENLLVEDYSLNDYAVNASQKVYKEGYRHYIGSTAPAAEVEAVCHIGNTGYATLQEALDYANNNVGKKVLIIMDKNYTLPAGYYTLPAKATLVIPRSDSQEADEEYVEKISNPYNSMEGYINPSVFRTLTLANGVNLDVHGTIEAAGMMYSSDSYYTGLPTGPYGQLIMGAGSKMTLQNGSELRAWGFVTGAGEIDARRGATVRELFQMADWKGAEFSVELIKNTVLGSGSDKAPQYSMFPISQYYIQSVEAPVTYHPGARLTSTAAVSVTYSGLGFTATANDINIVGVSGQDQAIFLMGNEADAENTWVRKKYDAVNDLQVYEVNNSAHIGSMVIKLGEIVGHNLSMNSAEFVLPITHNMKIHLLSGEMDFTQNTELLPGAEVEVDKESVVSIYTEEGNSYTGSLYIYDADQWGEYARGAKARALKYSATLDAQPSVRDLNNLPDASINVHGTFATKDGYVFTTEGGANIHSTNEDAGTFTFQQAAKEVGYTEDIWQVKGEIDAIAKDENANGFHSASCTSAKLKNGTGASPAYAETAGTVAGKSYCYINNRWTLMDIDSDNDCFMVDNYGQFYAKPAGYVPVIANKDAEGIITGNTDHTYSDARGNGKLYILLDNCQWWEVEEEDGYYHCVHPDNNTYYWWNENREDETGNPYPGWEEKRFTITWQNWDGSTIQTVDKEGNLVDNYSVTYGTQAVFLGTNPTREANVDYTYDFTGWSPALGPVTKDVTYTATYQPKQRKYTIIFCAEGGTEIERHFLARDEVPVCTNVPIKTGHILKWNPSVGPVTGDQTYEATWLDEAPATYEITWKNYDGSTLQTTNPDNGADAETVVATYTAGTPTKLPTSEYSYTFSGWKPNVAAATEDATYVAQFTEVPVTYTVNFYKEGTTVSTKDVEGNLLASRTGLVYGADAELPTGEGTTKEDAANTYTLEWKDLATQTKSIESVKGNADYVAVFTPTPKKYTVTLLSNPVGAAAFTGAGVYDYNTNVPIACTYNTQAYTFAGWSDNIQTLEHGDLAVTDNITLTANFNEITDLNVSTGVIDITSAMTRRNLIITSDGSTSGQLLHAENLTLNGNADFVLQQTIQAGLWYSIAVPWIVDANGGVYIGSSSTPAVLGKDYEICYYDGAVRAEQGKVDACWVYMKNLGAAQQVLEPGKAYMIYLKHGVHNQLVFRKKAGASLLTSELQVQQYESNTGEAIDGGWNAIANPALFHAYINAGANDETYGLNKGQVYDAENECYNQFDMSANKLVVGQPMYVQVPAAKSVIATYGGAYAAPVRRAKAKSILTKYEVGIAAADASSYADYLSISLNEGKEENAYVIGQDLTKFGVSSKVAQMWIDRYDAKLCVNTVAPEGEATTFPMSIFAPKAGEYSISIQNSAVSDQNEDNDLYVTYNGEAIWNLSDGAYTFTLNKGTTTAYGLRISAKKAPEVATGIDEAVVDAQGETVKMLINGQVFIIRGNQVYSIDGQLIK